MIFRYPGGKSKKSVKEKIFSYFTEQYSEFREPFVGGGGIYFNVPTDKKRWINDLDDNLISVYLALRDNVEGFIAECKSIEPAKAEEMVDAPVYNQRLKETFDNLAGGKDTPLKYFFVNRTVWAGRVNYDIKSRMYFSNPSGWNIVNTNKLELAAEIIKGTKITSGDYDKLLMEDGEDVLIYIDPPYFLNSLLAKNSRLYKHNFEVEDHYRLHELIKSCKHKIVLSYDAHPVIIEMYKDFNIFKEEWKYCGTSSAEGQSEVKQVGKELIIRNF